jgi:hypothetical protein
MNTAQWVDDAGKTWLSQVRLGPIALEMRRVTREFALQPPEKAELMLSLAIAPDGPIANPRALERLELLLSPEGAGERLPALPSGPGQDARTEEGNVRLVLTRVGGDPQKSYQLPYKGKEWADMMGATPWLETADPEIVRMSQEAVGGETDALRAAKKIESAVRSAMHHRGLGLGFATAAEAARQKGGDCTEHALVVAALARAAGMPSRAVIGLACAGLGPDDPQPKFYYHMWAEVYVGEWLPLDAALGSHDATHIALARSALARPDDLVEISGGVASLPGRMKIHVIKVGE